MDDVLTSRAINRATLERQLLLRRSPVSVDDAVARLVALNAQDPNPPYLGLWSRLDDFAVADLTAAIEERRVVRSTLLRGTQHLATAQDFGWLRLVLQPLLARMQRNTFGRQTEGVDLDELVDLTRKQLAGRTLIRPELARLLEERWPGAERSALGWSAQYLEPMLHPAPSGTWDVRGATPFVLASEWLGPLGGDTDPDAAAEQLVRRYLAGFGPATAGDVRAWSGVASMREVADRLVVRGELRVFRDEAGRTLLDLPDAPRPDLDTPAPVRLLPWFDNLMLAYSARTRVMSEDIRRQVCVGDAVYPTVLVDGAVAAMWEIEHAAGAATATLTVSPLVPLAPADRDAIAAEAEALVAFVHPQSTAIVRFTS